MRSPCPAYPIPRLLRNGLPSGVSDRGPSLRAFFDVPVGQGLGRCHVPPACRASGTNSGGIDEESALDCGVGDPRRPARRRGVEHLGGEIETKPR